MSFVSKQTRQPDGVKSIITCKYVNDPKNLHKMLEDKFGAGAGFSVEMRNNSYIILAPGGVALVRYNYHHNSIAGIISWTKLSLSIRSRTLETLAG